MPKWTKKDYEMVVDVLRMTEMNEDERLELAVLFKGTFAEDNPSFDDARFDVALYAGKLTRPSFRHGGWSRQDYVMVADVLHYANISEARRAVVAQAFADRFYFDNKQFVSDKFFQRAVGPDYRTRTYRFGPTEEEEKDVVWRAKHNFPIRRRPVRVQEYTRRRYYVQEPKRGGHKVWVGSEKWPSQVGMARLRRHRKRHHPRAFRESIRKGVRTRARRAR